MIDVFAEKYCGPLSVALQRAGGLAWLLAAEWLLYPVALATVVHPGDAVGFEYWMQGQPVPGALTSQQLAAGEVVALVAMMALNLLLLGTVVVVYRRANFHVAMWPVAALLVGVVGNGVLVCRHGAFRFVGGGDRSCAAGGDSHLRADVRKIGG